MAYLQHYRRTFIEHIRQIIGDPSGVIFADDEIKSLIETHMLTNVTTSTINAYNSRYRVNACCSYFPNCGCASGIYLLEVSSGIENAVYILDEPAQWVIFDSDDPENTAAVPIDGTNITVQYYMVETAWLLSKIFAIMSSNHAKLTLAFNIMGTNQDLKELSDAFWKTSLRWAAEATP